MDELSISYLEENTKIVKGVNIPNPLHRESTTPFSVVCEDPDAINRIFISEGYIKIFKLEKEDEAKAKELWLRGFEGEAWKYTEAKVPFDLFKGKALIQRIHQSEHTVNASLEEAISRIKEYPGNSAVTIITTEHDHRELGLAIATSRMIRKALQLKK